MENQAKGAIDEMGKQATDLGKETAEKGRKIFARAADQVVPAVKDTLHDVESRATEFLDQATEQIRKHPIQSLLLGFGFGALIGMAARGFRRAA